MANKEIEEPIGEAKVAIKGGEIVATIHLNSGKITSDKIKFLPWGKKKMLKKLIRPFQT